MKVLYFGSYKPSYSRNRIFIEGLRRNGVHLVECNDRSRSFFRYFRLAYRFLRLIGDCDVVLVGFPGQEMVFLARLLTRKPIIFDAFTSHYGGYILDRKYFLQKSLPARYYRFLDRWSCKLADIVILDTQAHIDFFVQEFDLVLSKFRRIFVGADDGVFYPRPAPELRDVFSVHFHGYYIPLHGIRYILEAAKALQGESVFFTIIGKGQLYSEMRAFAERLVIDNVNFVDPMPYEALAEHISQADVCLGIFGDSPKTQLVIPNKVFEAMASERPIITADTPAARELLENAKNCILIPPADAQALAQAILRLKGDSEEKNRLAREGLRLFREKLTVERLGRELKDIIITVHGT